MNRQEAATLPRLSRGHEERGKTDWAKDAVCLGTDDEKAIHRGRMVSAPIFFSQEERGRGKPDPDAAAKALCAVCPVREECLEHALRENERYGVWGGLSEVDRAKLRGVTRSRRPS